MILNKQKVLIYDTHNSIGRFIVRKIRKKIDFDYCNELNMLTKLDLSKFNFVVFINNVDEDLISLILIKKEIPNIIIVSCNSDNDHILRLIKGVKLLDLKETNKEFIEKLLYYLM